MKKVEKSLKLFERETKFTSIFFVNANILILRWKKLKNDLISKNIHFIIKPNTRFRDSRGEQCTMFVRDPSGNALEFKSFRDDSMIFER